ncbi:MAG: hypothetical protein CVV34_04610, partial [Methanomicrobiales archaeon HGW-Methanomicrobiales-5]
MFEKTTVGEWVVISLSLIYAVLSTFSKPINESGSYAAGAFIGSFIASLIILYIIYWIITRIFPNSKDWGIILWILAIVGISIGIIIILAIVVAFIFGMAGSSTNSVQTTEQITYQTIQTIASKPILIDSSGNSGWVQYQNFNDHFIIHRPPDWSIETADKSKGMDKSESLYSQIMNDFVYIVSPDAKGFVMIYGVDYTGTLYSIFDDKEKTQISNELYDEFVKGVKNGETDEVKFTSIQKDSNFYLINGNPARRATIYLTMGGESMSGDWYIIAHESKYYILGYSAMT